MIMFRISSFLVDNLFQAKLTNRDWRGLLYLNKNGVQLHTKKRVYHTAINLNYYSESEWNDGRSHSFSDRMHKKECTAHLNTEVPSSLQHRKELGAKNWSDTYFQVPEED